ncbi:hypothetical protein [Dactylosporangium sp. NPDC000521]|uniref:hypothetical protein n=1 Tax=Dactylosporangium sp. NPDC000521 TaxID=3363975 RepID=UPI003679B899
MAALAGYDASARDAQGLTCGDQGKAMSPVTTGDGRTVAMIVTTARRGEGFGSSMIDGYDWQVGLIEGDAVRLVGPTVRGVLQIALAPDGSRVVLVDGGVRVLDLRQGETRTVTTVGDATRPCLLDLGW